MGVPCSAGPAFAAAPELVPAAPDVLVAAAAPVALAAVAASPLPLHPLNTTLATTIVPIKAIRADPNPRLAPVIKTPELCDPVSPVFRERSRHNSSRVSEQRITAVLDETNDRPGNPAVMGLAPLD